jgi:hypothetical protein
MKGRENFTFPIYIYIYIYNQTPVRLFHPVSTKMGRRKSGKYKNIILVGQSNPKKIAGSLFIKLGATVLKTTTFSKGCVLERIKYNKSSSL